MSTEAGRTAAPVDNPFSLSAIARISDGPTDVVTIETAAVREVFTYLSRYLDEPGAGTSIAVVGDYGTGKTHLAQSLIAQARRTAGDTLYAIYLEAPADSFVALNRRFLTTIDRDDFHARLVSCFGPPGAVSDVRISAALAPVTDQPALGTAVGLLLRHEDENAVWDWLMGFRTPSLEAAGLTRPADVEATAIDAIGVVAWVYGRTSRLVVVLDEAEKIVNATNRPAETTAARFSRTLELFGVSGALLVVAGLPELLHGLDRRTRERLGTVVGMSALTGPEVEQFIRESQLRAFGEARLLPFTSEVVQDLTGLTGGVPRQVVRMCFHLYQRATEAGTRVTRTMVGEVQRARFDVAGLPDVRMTIRRTLTVEGYRYLADHVIGSMRSTPVDFWVPFEDKPAGCAVILTESVLKTEQADRLARRVLELRTALPDSEAVVVVVGHLAVEPPPELLEALFVEPLLYDPATFADAFSDVVKAVMLQLERVYESDVILSLRQRMERVQRQQSNSQRLLEQLSYQLDDVRALVDTNLRATDQPGPRPPLVTAGAAVLPPRVRKAFVDALNVLTGLRRLDVVLDNTFTDQTDEGSTAEGSTADADTLRWLLQSKDAVWALGASALLERLIETFRAGVEEWYRRLPALHGTDHDRELARICSAYDTAAGQLPVFELDALTAFGTAGEPRSLLDSLGARVRSAATPTPPRP